MSMLREDHPHIGCYDRYDSSAVRKRTLPHLPYTVGNASSPHKLNSYKTAGFLLP